MNSMKGFIEGGCDGTNPLVQLKSHFADSSVSTFHHDETLGISQTFELGKEVHSGPLTSLDNGLSLAMAPTNFSMDSLLREMKQINDHHQQQHQVVPFVEQHPSHLLVANKWLDEVDNDTVTPYKISDLPQPIHDWSREFLTSQLHPSYGFERFSPTWPAYQILNVVQTDDSWMEGFLKRDPITDFEVEHGSQTTDVSHAVEKEELSKIEDDISENFWETAQREWSNIENNFMWEHEYHDFSLHSSKEYKFEENNPAMEYPDALDEGIRRLQEGDVPNAVLFLEAAVQKDLKNSRAWFYLGRSRADNEQELAAISAFEKCLELDANNLQALMSLAVSYTNEGHSYKALESLFKWIKENPKYSQLASDKILEDYKVSSNAISSHEELIGLFLGAAQASDAIDPELQDGLGVLFNVVGDYDKAADCFKTALHILPESSTLWNKLGATLANGNRSEEALEAYHRALTKRPGYVRSRFNLGVACYNLKAYRESIEHYLSALTLQKNSHGPAEGTPLNTQKMSETIWSSLRLSMSLLGLTELLPACDSHQLDLLNREFGLV